MAAITPIAFEGNYKVIRTGAAQADTGQTDWISVPGFAKTCEIFFNITAVAGSTPIATPDLLAAAPQTRDDSHVVSIVADAGTGFTTPPTAAGQHRILVGPGITGIANDVTMAATGDSTTYLNVILPALLGIKLTLDRADGNETYTYSISVHFRA